MIFERGKNRKRLKFEAQPMSAICFRQPEATAKAKLKSYPSIELSMLHTASTE
jgi:hypothetical protein